MSTVWGREKGSRAATCCCRLPNYATTQNPLYPLSHFPSDFMVK